MSHNSAVAFKCLRSSIHFPFLPFLLQKFNFYRPNEAFKVLRMFLIFGLLKPYVLINFLTKKMCTFPASKMLLKVRKITLKQRHRTLL